MDSEINDELMRLIDSVVQGKRSGYKVRWTPKEFSLELAFVNLDEQQPGEACRLSAALALRMLIDEATNGRIVGFTAFWDGGEATNIETTVVLPYPIKMLKLTLNVA